MPPPVLAQPVAIAPQTTLRTGGPGAAEIAELWNVMLALGTLATVIVVVTLAIALFRRRSPGELPPEADRPPDPRGERANDETGGRGRAGAGRPRSERLGARWMVIGGVVFPGVVLTVLLVFSLRSLGALAPQRGERAPLTVEITGRQWWWEIRYLGGTTQDQVVTANELRIPVGTRVQLQLRAHDVIHSFWVPGLQGKTDMIPGRTNYTWIQADRAGAWRGQCAEFCGLQHAKMALMVVAQEPAEFRRWLAAQRLPAAEPLDSVTRAARETFLGTGCTFCHTVRGTPAAGRVGPDLTHVASRLTLAAGELPNTYGHLAGWIAHPQALKPGSHMPAVELDPREHHAVVHYLRSLR